MITAIAVASLIGLIVVLFQLTIDWLGGEALKAGLSTDASPTAIVIHGETLHIPQNMIRFADQRRDGPAERIDLVLHWPTLTGYDETHANAFDDISADAPIVFVSIAPRMTEVDSTGRLVNLYARFFADGGPGPDGLERRSLLPGNGYDTEEIYFEAGSAHPFVARCTKPDGSGIPSNCLREIYVGSNLSLTYRFRRPLLAEWAALDRGVSALAASFLKK
ncbi:MAG: hypothetical protein C0606_11530 [Hyphomicrobiales bacterium]|nr:MAG: hypothetical protein C0606_11530 [Hyphomicrobiales bacterium]